MEQKHGKLPLLLTPLPQVSSAVISAGVDNVVPVIAGLSNVYTHYITTFEEYQAQRYEAASTLYGPHTLKAYLEQYERLARNMVEVSLPCMAPTPSGQTSSSTPG